MWTRVVVNTCLQYPALKFAEKADAMLKLKVDDNQTSSRGSMSAIKAKDLSRIVQSWVKIKDPGLVEKLNSKMKVLKAN